MHYLYVIKSVKSSYVYVGQTSDLKRRFDEHNRGLSFATKAYAPFVLVYYEAYLSKTDALKRERMLKYKGSSIGHLKRRIVDSLAL